MRPEELTNERFERLIWLGAAYSNLDIDPLEEGERVAPFVLGNAIVWFYITRNGKTYSVALTLYGGQDAPARARRAIDVLEEHGLDAMLAELWAPHVEQWGNTVNLTQRGMTEQHWEDLFYFASHETIYFGWMENVPGPGSHWRPFLICNDLWTLACGDYSEMPLDQWSFIRTAHEVHGWNGTAAWTCDYNNDPPHQYHLKNSAYLEAAEWVKENKDKS